jgi:signal transduction histidine kinase
MGGILTEPAGSNPILDILATRRFDQLAAALRARSKSVISNWETLVRQVLPTADKLTLAQVRDHLPKTLSVLADALESASAKETKALGSQTTAHGILRFHQGYNVDELLIEYRLLRRVVIEQVEAELKRRTTMTEDIALSMGIDTILHEGVTAFVKHHTERLQAVAHSEVKYLSFLSHDLRNALNSVTLIMQVVKRRLERDPTYAEEVADIDSLQNAILETVEGMNRLLQAERLRSETVNRKISPVNLFELVTQVTREFSQQAKKKGVALTVNISPDVVIPADKECLRIVIQNFVGNAVKFSAKGSVRVEWDGKGSVSVSDDGPGIAPEQVDRIFETFRRGESHGQDGVGLGLAIALQAAKLLGGRITVSSQIGVGSTFCLVMENQPNQSPGAISE